MYKLFVKKDSNDNIIDKKTHPFIKDNKDWIDVGEQKELHVTTILKNEQDVSFYKYVNGEIVDRTASEKNDDKRAFLKKQKIEQARMAAIKRITENDPTFQAKKSEIQSASTLTALNNIEV